MSQLIKINLLPPDKQKAAASSVDQLHRAPITWIVVAVMVILPLFLWVPTQLNRKQLAGLSSQIEALRPRVAEVTQLRQLSDRLRAQEEAFRELGMVHRRWAKRLNILSDMAPNGIWFTEFALDQARGLVIQGSAIGQGGTEMVNIGRLVQDLKSDEDFRTVVRDIQIESIKRFQERDIDIVQFTLTCTLVGSGES